MRCETLQYKAKVWTTDQSGTYSNWLKHLKQRILRAWLLFLLMLAISCGVPSSIMLMGGCIPKVSPGLGIIDCNQSMCILKDRAEPPFSILTCFQLRIFISWHDIYHRALSISELLFCLLQISLDQFTFVLA